MGHMRVFHSTLLRHTGILSAYLSNCQLPSEEGIRTVIVVGVADNHCIPTLGRKLMNSLHGVRFEGRSVDVLPMNVKSIPTAVLETGLKIA